jgi:putative chitinase
VTISKAIRLTASSKPVADVASDAWQASATKLEGLGANTNLRLAHIVGQCSHESAGFRLRFENLNYSADGLWAIFRRHFDSRAHCNQYARKPEKIANRVYRNRMGNGSEASGDGWRYRGRGFIQLTGKSNYKTFGNALGLDFVGSPELAALPENSWMVAVKYMASRSRSGLTALEWADKDDVGMVTKIINGGTHGLQDRKRLTAKAKRGLSNETTTAEWQALLLSAGFNPGPVDGLMGPKTKQAIADAEVALSATGEALAAKLRLIEG